MKKVLLKILEEPPSNIVFILISTSKAIFLPTIRSRISIERWEIEKKEIELNIDLKRLSLKDIFEFLKENRFLKKEEAKEIIQVLLKDALLKYDLKLNENEIERFQKAIELIDLNTRPSFVFADLFLTILLREDR